MVFFGGLFRAHHCHYITSFRQKSQDVENTHAFRPKKYYNKAMISRSRHAQHHRGFTLIELLVVISIISLLSSVILAALSSARQKGQYAAVQESLIQMRNVYELQYTNTNSYAALLPVGMANASSYGCSSGSFTSPGSNYCTVNTASGCHTLYGAGTQADNICTDIVSKLGPTGQFWFGVSGTFSATDYAFAVQNQSNTSSYFCIRSSGGNVTTTSGGASCLNRANW